MLYQPMVSGVSVLSFSQCIRHAIGLATEWFMLAFHVYKENGESVGRLWMGLTPSRPSSSPSPVMAEPARILLFGDQTVDPTPVLKQLYKQSTDSVILSSFLLKTVDALRQEIASYDSSDRASFPSFDSIQSLADVYSHDQSPNEAISTALLCISQLGLLLMYVSG